MNNNILLAIIYFGHIFLALNTYLYLKSFRKNSGAFKILSFYLLLTLVVQLVSDYYSYNKIPNKYLSHFYFIGQLILLGIFYIKVFESILLKKGIKVYLILSLVSLVIYFLNFPENLLGFDVFEVLITSIPLIFLSFLFFAKNLDHKKKMFIYFNSGFFLYLVCSTLLFSSGEIEIKRNVKRVLWYFNSSLYIIYQTLIFIEWYKHLRKKEVIQA